MPGVRLGTIEVVVFRTAGAPAPAPEFLVLKRSDRASPYPGLWQTVSGRIEKGEKAWEAAVREVREETGLRLQELYNTPLTNTFYVMEDDAVNLSPVFAARVDAGAEIILSDEHSAFAWLGREEAVARLVWPGQKSAIQCVMDFILREGAPRNALIRRDVSA